MVRLTSMQECSRAAGPGKRQNLYNNIVCYPISKEERKLDSHGVNCTISHHLNCTVSIRHPF